MLTAYCLVSGPMPGKVQGDYSYRRLISRNERLGHIADALQDALV